MRIDGEVINCVVVKDVVSGEVLAVISDKECVCRNGVALELCQEEPRFEIDIEEGRISLL